ncbi:MAG: ParB N-terminal domain-containing protein [Mycobacterium sp.]|jgi:ParB family chromosome partitioning protein
MAKTVTSAPRRPARPGGRKTANRFAALAGGDDLDGTTTPPPLSEAPDSGGLIAAMSAAATHDASRVVHIPPAHLCPHPFNDSRRSEPQPGDPKWEELVNGVRANGVRLPVLAVPREVFLATRPAAAQHLHGEARYVLVYGHRRRAAALEAGQPTVPVVVDESIMVDDGDLDAMATENLGRQDLSELAEASLFAHYSDLGLSQRAIADRLGVNQATVSRRLSLLLLAPELREAVTAGVLPSAEASAIGAALPYGAPRRWQKTKDDDQDTDTRRGEQIHAMTLIRDRGWLASRAAERVVAERHARAQAAELGVTVVDNPSAVLGEGYHERRMSAYDPAEDVVATIDPGLGTLLFYRRHPEPSPSSPASGGGASVPTETNPGDAACITGRPKDAKKPRRDTTRGADDARAHRGQACAALAALPPSTRDLLAVLAEQYVSGVAGRSAGPAAAALLRDWNVRVEGAGDKARNLQAWQLAVAAAELHVRELHDRPWDAAAAAHLRLLTEKVGYQPTAWERDRLEGAR